MNNLLNVTVIVPVYNHRPFLQERFDTILNQSFQNFEVIVLDDCSNDGSTEFINAIETHPKISSVLINPTNSGSPFSQWIKGIEKAKGELIWIAESDDSCALNLLEKLVPFFADPECNLAFADSNDIDENGSVINNRNGYIAEFGNIFFRDFKMDGSHFVNNYMAIKNVIPNASGVVFRKSSVHDIARYQSLLASMRCCGDWLFWTIIALTGKVSYSHSKLNGFRTHTQTTRTHNSYEKLYKRYSEELQVRHEMSLHGYANFVKSKYYRNVVSRFQNASSPKLTLKFIWEFKEQNLNSSTRLLLEFLILNIRKFTLRVQVKCQKLLRKR